MRRTVCVAAWMLMLAAHHWCAGQDFQPWAMQDNFANGIPSWQSYPLAQDIGYDPSVYTTSIKDESVLVRDVINEGEKADDVGLIRPLSFHLTASTRVTLKYSVRFAGTPVGAKIVLAGADGTAFEAPLPLSSDPHQPHVITGAMFHPLKDADIRAVVVIGSTRAAALGAHSLLTVYSFSVSASRPPAVDLVMPRIVETSSGETPVVEGFATAGQTTRFTFDAPIHHLAIRDGHDAPVEVNPEINGPQVSFMPPASAAPGLWTVEASNDHARLSFRILVLPPAADENKGTSAVFTDERLAQLKSQDRYAELRSTIHREALLQAQQLAFNPKAGDSIALFPKESVHAGLVAYAALLHSYGSAITYGALDFRLNGDRQSLENVRRAVATVAAWKTWTPPWFVAHGMHTYYQVGTFTEQVALGFDLVSDQLSPDERAAMERAFMKLSIQPTMDDYYLRDRMPTSASNHMAHSVGGAIEAWVACLRADPQWRQQQASSLAQLLAAYQDLLVGLYPGDGSEREPAGYEIFAGEGMSYGAAALRSIGIVPDTSAMMESFWWIRYAEVSPSLLLDTGDTGSTLAGLYGYAWVAENSRDPAVRWLYDTVVRPSMDQPRTPSEHLQAPPNLLALSRAPNVLDLLCCSHPAAAMHLPPPSRIFPLRGSAVLRQGWAEDQTVISLRVGPWMNHEHHDEGSFQLASRGDLLVGEGGYANYYFDPRYKNYFSESEGHNVVLIDGDPFSQRPYDGVYYKAFSSYPRITSSLLTGQIDFLDADMKPAYGDQLQTYRRTYLFLKPDLLVIRDDLRSAAPRTFQWLLHSAPGAAADPQGTTLTVEGPNHHARLTAIVEDSDKQWQIAPGPIATDDFTNLDQKQVLKRYILSLASHPSTSAQFLVALSVSSADNKNGDSTVVDKQTTANAEGFVQKRADGKTEVFFRRQPGILQTDGIATDGAILAVTVAASGGESHILATDAQSLKIPETGSFALTSPADVVVDRTGDAIHLTLQCAAHAMLKADAALQKNSLEVDGKKEADGAQPISLSAGSHTLHFNLRRSLKQQAVAQPAQRPLGGLQRK